MNNFIYNTPTKIYFGKNQESRSGEIIKSYNYKSILLVYGMSSMYFVEEKKNHSSRFLQYLLFAHYLWTLERFNVAELFPKLM